MATLLTAFKDRIDNYFLNISERSRQLFWLSLLFAALAIASLSTERTPGAIDFFLIVSFGVLVALASLFAFPYATIWGSKPTKLEEYNSIRAMLIGVITGAFALSSLYFTLRSAEESALSAKQTKTAAEKEAETERRREARAEIGQAVRLLSSKELVARTAGLYVISELLDQQAINPVLGHRLVSLYVRTHAEPPFDQESWSTMAEKEQRAAENSPKVGIGSLSKRAGDIQFALDVLSKQEKKKLSSGLYSPRVDLRDVHLQGAALGRAILPGALFSGSHLDYMDTRTRLGPYANFRMADFQGATLFGAYLNNADLSEAKLNTPQNADGSIRKEQETDLQYASFRAANLTRADLSSANLTKADLRAATLKDANLSQADLTGARLDKANLTGARLAGADLVAATYSLSTEWPKGYWATGRPVVNQLTSRLCRLRSCSMVSWQILKTGVFTAGTPS